MKKDARIKKLIALFLNFAKIGSFTFGGGYAMLPLIERVCVKEKQWITEEEMTDLPVLAEMTPGPVAINCATFVGYRQMGVPGALAATFGMIVPSFAILFVISVFFDRFLENKWAAGAFFGIKIAVGVLIVDASVRLFAKLKKNALTVGIGIASFLLMTAVNVFALKISTIVFMLLASAVGFIVYRIGRQKTEGAAK